ncbi:hypothetical protein ACMFMF_007424 [Clarireedia jacksonii]
MPWPCKGLRRASVQSFGFGGSNSHAILDDAYNHLLLAGLNGNHNTVAEPPPIHSHMEGINGINGGHECTNGMNGTSGAKGAHELNGINESNGVVKSHRSVSELNRRLLVWSAADESGIARVTEVWKDHFLHTKIPSESQQSYLQDLAHTLANRRTHLIWRTFAVTADCDEVGALVDQMSAPSKASDAPKLGFVFTGQGAQWFGMGRELLARYPVFEQSITEAGEYLGSIGCSWDLITELLKDKDETNINKAEYSQALCTILQVALVDLMEYIGVHATALIGHSSGEIAAAYAAKALSRESAWKVAYFRGMLSSRLELSNTMKGGMLAVGLSRNDIRPYLAKISTEVGTHRLVVACINSPKNLTISGDAAHLDHLQALLEEDRIFARRLKVSIAYHSFQMQEIADEYLASMGTLECQEPSSALSVVVSSLTGTWVRPNEMSKPEYWVQNMLQPVLFSDALSVLCSSSSSNQVKKLDGSHRSLVSITQLVEIGPHAALQGPIKEILRYINHEKDIRYINILKRNNCAVQSTLELAGRLHCAGYPIDLPRVNGDLVITEPSGSSLKTLANMPEYPFNHTQTYWHESRLSKDSRCRRIGKIDLLGTPSQDWNPLEAKWRNIIRTSELPWVEDHQINGVILYPGAGMVTMAIEAAKQLADNSREITAYILKNTSFHTAMNIPAGAEGLEVDTYLRPRKDAEDKDSGWFDFRLCTYDGGNWSENCNGSIQVIYAAPNTDIDDGKEDQLWTMCHREKYLELEQRCSISVDPKSFYDHLLKCGYGYGPFFKPITSIAWDDGDNAVCQIKTFRCYNDEGTNTVQPHIIHPTTFDGVVQTMFAACTKGGTHMMPTMVPAYVDRIWLSSKGLSHAEADSIKVCVKTQRSGLRGVESHITALDATGQEVLMEINGTKATVVASTDDADVEQKLKARCHKLEWKPDLDLMSVADTQAYFDTAVTDEPAPIEFFTDVDFLVMAHIQSTLQEIKDNPDLTLKSDDHTEKYYQWMEHRVKLLEDGADRFSSEEWRTRLKDYDYVANVMEKVASGSKRGLLITVICKNLVKFLTGEMDILSVLFQGDLVKDYYYELWHAVPCIKRLSSYLDSYVHKNPGAKFLEIGAGTGALTKILMETITITTDGQLSKSRYSSFDYTDISPSFISSAQDIYQSHGKRMKFKILNIENDPEAQRFECGTYDIIAAAAVLHATTNLSVTMANCRKLLKPEEVPAINFIFGLLEGWWLSSEDYRKLSPCINENRWDEVLKQAGFSGSEIVFHDYNDSIHHDMSVIISTAMPKTQVNPLNSRLILIHATEQKKLALKIQTALQNDFIVQLATIEQALEETTEPNTVMVILYELDRPLLSNLTPDLFDYLHKILTRKSKVLWVTRGGTFDSPTPEFHLVEGLFRSVESETDAVFASLSLESQGYISSRQMDHIAKVSQILLTSRGIETEYIEDDGVLNIARVMDCDLLSKEVHDRQLTHKKGQTRFGSGVALQLTIGSPGLLNTLHFIEDKEQRLELQPDEMEIQVRSIGVNFKDILIALGRLDQDNIGGTECAGIVTRLGANCQGFEIGSRVAVCGAGSCKSFARVDYHGVAKIPDGMTFSTAAAVSANHATSWHSLVEVARVQPGEIVLIHSGAGGTGQAAIQIAQYLGAKVMTTVGTKEKMHFLMARYNIPPEYIFSSRDTVFAKSIKRLTSGRGVDVVLNSLSGEGLAASWECIAPYGRFIEIGKKDIFSHNTLQMYHFARNVTFSAVDLSNMSTERPELLLKSLNAILSLVAKGELKPSQPMQVYGVSELEKAFRRMQSGKNSGKIVIEMRPDDYVEAVLDTKPSSFLDSNATYVIAGGLGGLGRSISRWFVNRGARNLILLSRSGSQSIKSQSLIEELTSQGVCLQTPACDISDAKALKRTLDECLLDMPSIKGCIQASMVLRDSTFENMNFEMWNDAIQSKVHGSWNLHTLLLNEMDFFIMFSSISGIVGFRGQSNYAAGNTYQDALARYRVASGEKGIALDLGAFDSVGILVEDEDLRSKFLIKSLLDQLSESDLFALLDCYCNPMEQYLLPCQPILGASITANLREHGLDAAYWLKKPLFSQVTLASSDEEAVTTQAGHINFQSVFAAASSLAEATTSVTDGLVMKLAKMLSVSQDDLDISKPMHIYGVDSLVAVELRTWFAKELHADVAIFDILGSLSISDVAALSTAKSMYRKDQWT